MQSRKQKIFRPLMIFTGLGLALCPLVRGADMPAVQRSPIEWRLVMNSENPAGPGRWIHSPLVDPTANSSRRNSASPNQTLRVVTPFAVRAGERVVLEEEHGRVSYSLVGRALGSARVGEPLRMQLYGSNAPVVRVVALSAGRVGFPAPTLTAGVR